MTKRLSLGAWLLALCLLISGCLDSSQPVPIVTLPPATTLPQIAPSVPTPTEEATTPATAVPTTLPEHSALYIPGLDVEQVILYFNEVCLDTEFSYGGDATVVQKWTEPIYYFHSGDFTPEDIAILEDFTVWLNTIEGFPGIHPTEDYLQTNMYIYFCTREEIRGMLGDDFSYVDGGTRFWYRDNQLYDATICYASDSLQYVRNGVILEEIYNCLGAAQDTVLREDSIIYSHYSEPQQLTQEDILILQLLYHPDILPGMNATQCEEVIRRIYY